VTAAPELCGRVASAGTPEAAVAALKAHGAAPAVVGAAADALGALARCGEACCLRCLSAGALDLLTQALWAASEARAPQVAAVCRAIAALAPHPGAEAKVVAKRGPLYALVAALLLAPQDALVQSAGLEALSVCARTPGASLVAAQAGAVEAVVAAMRLHGSCEDVQRHGSAALWRLAFETDNVVQAWERTAMTPGGLAMLWRSFRTHSLALSPAEHVSGAAAAAQRGAGAVARAANANVDARMLQAALQGTLADFVAALLAHADATLREGSSRLRLHMASAVTAATTGLVPAAAGRSLDNK
jgi:hypothetical protein